MRLGTQPSRGILRYAPQKCLFLDCDIASGVFLGTEGASVKVRVL